MSEMEEDRVSLDDSDDERQRKADESKESRRIAKLRGAMLVVAADDWLKEQSGEKDDDLYLMMHRPDDIEAKDWEDALLILAELKRYDYSSYWINRLLPQPDDGPETDKAPQPEPEAEPVRRGISTGVNCKEVLSSLTESSRNSSTADTNTDILASASSTGKENILNEVGPLANGGASAAAHGLGLANKVKPLKSCLRYLQNSYMNKGNPIRKISFGITRVAVYFLSDEEKQFKKVECRDDFVECNGRKLRDISSSECGIRMEEIENLDLFMARKLKYKQAPDILNVEEEVEAMKEENEPQIPSAEELDNLDFLLAGKLKYKQGKEIPTTEEEGNKGKLESQTHPTRQSFEELDNMNMFLTQKLKYKQVQNTNEKLEEKQARVIEEETKKGPTKKARRPVVITCDMIKKQFKDEMAKTESKRNSDDNPAPDPINDQLISLNQPLPSSGVGACSVHLLPKHKDITCSRAQSNTSSDIANVVSSTRAPCLGKPSSENALLQPEATPDSQVDRRRLRRANNVLHLPKKAVYKSREEEVPEVKEAFGDPEDRKSRKKDRKPQKMSSETATLQLKDVDFPTDTCTISDCRMDNCDTKSGRPDHCEEQPERQLRSSVKRNIRSTEMGPPELRSTTHGSDKPKFQHKATKSVRNKVARAAEEGAIHDYVEPLSTGGPNINNVKQKKKTRERVDGDDTLDEQMAVECRKTEKKESLLTKRPVDQTRVHQGSSDRVHQGSSDRDGRKKKVKKSRMAPKAESCRMIEVKPADGHYDFTETAEGIQTPTNRNESDVDRTQDFALEETSCACPSPVTPKHQRRLSTPNSNNPGHRRFDTPRSDKKHKNRAPNSSENIIPERSESIETIDLLDIPENGSTKDSNGRHIVVLPKEKLSARFRNVCRRFRQRVSTIGQRIKSMSCLS